MSSIGKGRFWVFAQKHPPTGHCRGEQEVNCLKEARETTLGCRSSAPPCRGRHPVAAPGALLGVNACVAHRPFGAPDIFLADQSAASAIDPGKARTGHRKWEGVKNQRFLTDEGKRILRSYTFPQNDTLILTPVCHCEPPKAAWQSAFPVP